MVHHITQLVTCNMHIYLYSYTCTYIYTYARIKGALRARRGLRNHTIGLCSRITLQNKENITELYSGIVLRNKTTELCHRIILRDNIPELYHRNRLRDCINESCCGSILRNYIMGLYTGMILWNVDGCRRPSSGIKVTKHRGVTLAAYPSTPPFPHRER